MSNDTNAAPENFQPDGSLADAAMMMPDFDGDMDDPSPSNTRTEIIEPREAANRRGTPPLHDRQQRRQDDRDHADGCVAAPNLPPDAEEKADRADPSALQAGSPDDGW